MADGPFQPFTADPSGAGMESTVGRMGGKQPVEMRGPAGSQGAGSGLSPHAHRMAVVACPRCLPKRNIPLFREDLLVFFRIMLERLFAASLRSHL